MTYGLEIKNPSGELVITTEGYLPHYAGKATYVSTTAQTATAGGFSTFTFTYSGLILPALKLASGRLGSILSMTQSGSTWTIKVNYTDGSTDTVGFHNQSTDAEIFVFVSPTGSPAGSYGLALFNSAGDLAADLTQRPLTVNQRIALASGVSTATLTNPPTVPAVMGRCWDKRITMDLINPSTAKFYFSNSVFDISGTTFRRNWSLRKFMQAANDASAPESQLYSADTWITDVNGLT